MAGLLCSCATARKPIQITPPSVGKVTAAVVSTKKAIASAKAKAVEIQSSGDINSISQLVVDLDLADTETTRLEQEVITYSSQVVQQTEALNLSMVERNDALIGLDKEKAAHRITSNAYHRLKLFGAMIVGGLAGLFSIRYLGAITSTPPWGWLTPILVGLGAASAFFWLL